MPKRKCVLVLVLSRTILAAFIYFTFVNPGHAQENNKRMIIGTWSFKKIEFLRVFDDSVAMREKGRGMTTTFVDSVNMVSKRKTAKGSEITDSSKYSISTDGKRLSQSDSEAVIMKLTDRELVFRIRKDYKNMFPIETDSIVASFLRNGKLQIENVMTTERKEDVFACECKGDLSYELSADFVSAFNQKVVLAGKEELRIDPGMLNINFEKDILYKAQVIDDKEKIGVEALTTEELRYAVEQFIFLYVANELVGRKATDERR